MDYKINITHLYPDLMNLYGDLGNVVCLQKRLEWRNIEVNINNVSIGDNLEKTPTDLFFFGGGQDNDQLKVFSDLIENKKDSLLTSLISGVPMLAICGGYQLLGKYFLDGNNQKIAGIGILGLETVAPGLEMHQRAVGNLVTELTPDSPISNHYTKLKTLVGFENHSGRTRFINPDLKPLGKVLIGVGDNEDAKNDGILKDNIIGSYMHGSLLPKNPHLADYLITQALIKKYPEFRSIPLDPLDDSIEVAAHQYILKAYNL